MSQRGVCVLSASTFSQEGGIQRVTQMVLHLLRQQWPAFPLELLSLHDRRGESLPNSLGEDRNHIQYRSFASRRLPFSLAAIQTMVSSHPHLVISDHAHLSLLPWLASKVRRVPFVAFVYHAELPNLSPWRRRALRRADLIIAISDFAAEEARKVLGNEIPIAICPLGLNPSYIYWAGHPHPVPQALAGRAPILIVGRMVGEDRRKGHESLIRAMPAIIREVPEALLVVVGRGPFEIRLKQLAEEVGMQSHVHFAGFVLDHELPAYYKAARVFAMPSYAEGFGLVYLEAMYHGKPCIAGNRDASGEVIAEGETGLLVEPGNVRQLEEALLKVLKDPAYASRLGAAGRSRLEQHFTYDRFAQRLQHLLAAFLPAGMSSPCAASPAS